MFVTSSKANHMYNGTETVKTEVNGGAQSTLVAFALHTLRPPGSNLGVSNMMSPS